MKTSFSKIILISLISIFFISCNSISKPTVFLSDRHGLSYTPVKQYAEKNGPVTLVLIDYHNDINADEKIIRSSNWVGQLIEKNYVNSVYWISGRNLHAMNRQARLAWLNRNLKNKYPDTAALILDTVKIIDFNELIKLKLPKNTVITFDFDVLTKDPGPDPEKFAIEAAQWISKQKTKLVTLSFSAIYEPEPVTSWNWLYNFIKNYSAISEWKFQSGDFNEREESLEDLQMWKNWESSPDIFKKPGYSFYKGAHLWINAPEKIQNVLLEKKVKAFYEDDQTTEKVLQVWNSAEYQTLQKKYNLPLMEKYADIAISALKETLNGKFFEPVTSSTDLSIENNTGIAVRFKSTKKDRGCLALYCGVSDLEKAVKYCAFNAAHDPRYPPITKEDLSDLYVNITFFSDWKQIQSPTDFIPGYHSLIIQLPESESLTSFSDRRTLLQSPIAAEKTYSQKEFLDRLCLKSGLEKNYWTKKDAEYFICASIFFEKNCNR